MQDEIATLETNTIKILKFIHKHKPFKIYLCCVKGNASGCVRVFGAVGEDLELVFVDRKQEHSEAITDLAADKDVLASADEGGSVVLWHLSSEELLKSHTLPNYG